MLHHPAFFIFLRHPAALQQQVLSKLLIASKALQAAVEEQCIGQAYAAFLLPNTPSWDAAGVQQAQQQLSCFAAWLSHHAHLLKILQLDLLPPADEPHHSNRGQVIRTVPDRKGEAEKTLTAALQEAKAVHGRLSLQSFKLLHGRSTAVSLLQELPITVASLHLEIGKNNNHLHPRQRLKGNPKLPSIRMIAPVLEQLTALTSLTIVCPEAHKLAPALPALSRLIQLSITYLDVRSVRVLGQLPVQLSSLHFNVLEKYEVYYDEKDDSDVEAEQQRQHQQEGGAGYAAEVTTLAAPEVSAAFPGQLTVQQLQAAAAAAETTAAGKDAEPLLQLGGLTALQRLTSHTYRLQAQDKLPAGLQVLELGSCSCIQPLQHLQHLQHICIHKEASLAASDLTSLGSHLKRLQSVGLAYQTLETAAAAASAWPKLPLSSLELELDFTPCSYSLVQQIGQASGLTRLCVIGACGNATIATSPDAFGGVLQQLQSLQELELHSLKLSPVPAQTAIATATAVCSTKEDRTEAGMSTFIAAVAALPRLTSLTLSNVTSSSGEWLLPCDLAPLAASTQLTCLHVFMSWIDDEVVMGLASSLKFLKRFGLDHCIKVTDVAAVALVRELQQLSWLSVWGTSVRNGEHLKQIAPGMELVGT